MTLQEFHNEVECICARLAKSPRGPQRLEVLKKEVAEFPEDLALVALTLITRTVEFSEPERRVVIVVHGIRTRGTWQKYLAPRLSEQNIIPELLDYGWFNSVSFLVPPIRKKKIEWFLHEYERIRRTYPGVVPSLVAHSFGTYIACRAMRKYCPHIKFDRMILCGSIVPTDFPWSEMFDQQLVQRVLNDRGTLDVWAGNVHRFVADAGPSGRDGFVDNANNRVTERVHPEWGHGDFFYDTNFRDGWVSFLNGNCA